MFCDLSHLNSLNVYVFWMISINNNSSVSVGKARKTSVQKTLRTKSYLSNHCLSKENASVMHETLIIKKRYSVLHQYSWISIYPQGGELRFNRFATSTFHQVTTCCLASPNHLQYIDTLVIIVFSIILKSISSTYSDITIQNLTMNDPRDERVDAGSVS